MVRAPLHFLLPLKILSHFGGINKKALTENGRGREMGDGEAGVCRGLDKALARRSSQLFFHDFHIFGMYNQNGEAAFAGMSNMESVPLPFTVRNCAIISCASSRKSCVLRIARQSRALTGAGGAVQLLPCRVKDTA
jgi:hypothetical protein